MRSGIRKTKSTGEEFTMRIEAEQKVAFVGENGAGKTTLTKLLMRLYDVTEGSICYGQEDIGEIIERGTHRELMELNGQYAEMFRCQAKYYQDIYIPQNNQEMCFESCYNIPTLQ